MLEDDKKNKKVAFSEEDAAALLVKYDATTVLTLLQELSNSNNPGGKIDWNELVKRTATGISNAREYQMLWRHLAYRDDLTENLEDGAEPLDDDSDLDCEMEAVPPINNEAASEASACVKVMIASGSLSERGPSSSTIEAPMTIHIPTCHPSTNPEENIQHSNSIQGTSVIFPVTVQRQTLPTGSVTESVEAKGTSSGKLSSKRRRKAWSEEEDKQLREFVQQCGEGNWATMSKGDDFPIKRSPNQLAQASPVYIIMREEPTRHWLQKTPVLKMAVTFTNLSRRFWSRKRQQEPKISEGASVNSKTDSSMWGSETLEFTLVENMSSSSGSMKPKRHNSWEERKTNREYDVVLVPSDGECVSGSESEHSDWSIGWLEPHGPGFPSMDETDNNFAVLVPCYGRGYGGTVNDTNSKTLSNIRNFLDSYSAESMKSTDNWLFSWK